MLPFRDDSPGKRDSPPDSESGWHSCWKCSQEGLHGPYLSIRTSSWAPRDKQTEKLVTKGRLPQTASVPSLADAPRGTGAILDRAVLSPGSHFCSLRKPVWQAVLCVSTQQVRPQ